MSLWHIKQKDGQLSWTTGIDLLNKCSLLSAATCMCLVHFTCHRRMGKDRITRVFNLADLGSTVFDCEPCNFGAIAYGLY